jgi:hypothetical protein
MNLSLPEWLDWLPLPRGEPVELAPRRLGMPLDLPSLQTHSRRGQQQQKIAPPPESWRDLNDHPINLLREVERYLKRLNSERVALKKRLAWVEHCLQYACPAIRKVYSEHYKGEALPESHDRREGLVAAINTCAQLAAGYKHILKHDYELADQRYVRVRDRVQRCALRVLEFIRMEQRLRALRYQKLPPVAWLDCNRIFFALAQCEDLDQPQEGLTCMQLQSERKSPDPERRAAPVASIRQVYAAIQVYGLLDTNTLSSPKMHVADAQLCKVLPELKVTTDAGGTLATGQVIVYHNQDRPPFFERQDEKAQAALAKERELLLAKEQDCSHLMAPIAVRINLTPLEEALVEEHRQLLARFDHSDEEGRPGVMDPGDLSLLLTVDAMCDKLHLKRRREQRDYAVGRKVMYVYNGFMSAYKLLMDAVAEDDDSRAQLADENQLRDALAGRSALIASDEDSNIAGQWFVMDISEGGVHIKTRESQFTTSLFIGQLVAYSFSREELREPAVGYICRLSRNAQGDMEVTLRSLAKRAKATAVQSSFLSQNDMALPGILTLKDDGPEGLILHQSHRLTQGTPVTVGGEGEQRTLIIADTLDIQREFVFYSLLAGETSTVTTA